MSLLQESLIKSPLRYPGGKSKAVYQIMRYIPLGTKKLCSPFFGGGSLEIICAQLGIKVYGYDLFEPLVNFWQLAISNPKLLARCVEKYRPLSKRKFYELRQKQFTSKSKLERAAIFFVLNRTSFSGSTLSGGMATGGPHNNPRFTISSIERLRNFKIKNLTVNAAHFLQSIPKHKDSLLYLDPPYLTKGALYGQNGDLHKTFEHYKLFKLLKKHDNWILSYNNSPATKTLYSDYHMIKPEWNYGMSSKKTSNEILVLSHAVAKANGIK